MKRSTGRLRGLLAAALITGAGGCAAAGPADGPAPNASESPLPEPAPPGNVVVTVGEQVETPVGEENPLVLTLAVDGIQVLDSCPGRAAPTQSPTFGQFVVLDVTATLRAPEADPAELPAGAATYAGLGAERFVILDEAGTAQEITSTDASWACFEDAELLPGFVDVDQTVSGYVVLDSMSPHGTVAFSPSEATGWEWLF